MVSEIAGEAVLELRMILLAPLVAACLLGWGRAFARPPYSRRAVSAMAVGGMATSFVASVLSFASLLTNEESSSLFDRVGTWLGAGVGSITLVGDLAFRLDALSAVFCLVISAVGLLLILHASRSLALDAPTDGDFQRFFCFASFQLSMCLLFVLANDLLLMLLGFAGVGVGAFLLAGFRYADSDQGRVGTRTLLLARAGDIALLVAFLLLFRVLSSAGAPGLGVTDVRTALIGVEGLTFALPGWTGLGEIPFLDVVGLCLLLAAVGMCAQLAVFAGLSPGAALPLSASALMQTVTGAAATGYLLARFSFVFTAAPLASAALATAGAFAALAGAVVACRAFEIGRILGWSSVSQLGLVMLAAGLGAHTVAVFHLVGHAFYKGLLLVTVSVVVLALRGEQDLRRMGSLGSRLTLTRIGFFVAGLSLAGGLPLTAGFFSAQQIALAARGAGAGLGYALLYPLVLVTLGLTAFYVVRLIYLSLYGETHLPPALHRDEVEDPKPVILWIMGILATLSVLAALIGFPQFWADFFFAGDIENSNSLRYFLSGIVSHREETPLGVEQAWSVAGWVEVMALLGLSAAILGYAVRPSPFRTLAVWAGRMRPGWVPPMPRLPSGWTAAAGQGWAQVRAALAARRPSSPASEPDAVMPGAGPLRLLTDRVLRPLQSGFVQHSLALSLAGSLALLVYFLWKGEV
jgi:NADH-quinone oxidoreductase subunit L